MDTSRIRRVMSLNQRLEEAEARQALSARRYVELTNRRCRNDRLRLKYLKRTAQDICDAAVEIEAIKRRLEAAKA